MSGEQLRPTVVNLGLEATLNIKGISWVLFSGPILPAKHRPAISSSHWLCWCLTSAAAFHLPALSSDFTSLFSPLPPSLLPSQTHPCSNSPWMMPKHLALAASTSVEGLENNPYPSAGLRTVAKRNNKTKLKTTKNPPEKEKCSFYFWSKSPLTWIWPGVHCQSTALFFFPMFPATIS